MKRGEIVKQYGRYRQRVVLADHWVESDSKEDVFSLSSDSSSESSSVQTGNGRGCVSASLSNSEKKHCSQNSDKENKCPKQSERKFDGIISFSKDSPRRKCHRAIRKPLNTRNGQQKVNRRLSATSPPTNRIDFSEIDEYSLLVESASLDANDIIGQTKELKKTAVETSTPYRRSQLAVNKRQRVIKDSNISMISPVPGGQCHAVGNDASLGTSEMMSDHSVSSPAFSDVSKSQSSSFIMDSVKQRTERESLFPAHPYSLRSVTPADLLQQSADLFSSPVMADSFSIYNSQSHSVRLKKPLHFCAESRKFLRNRSRNEIIHNQDLHCSANSDDDVDETSLLDEENADADLSYEVNNLNDIQEDDEDAVASDQDLGENIISAKDDTHYMLTNTFIEEEWVDDDDDNSFNEFEENDNCVEDKDDNKNENDLCDMEKLMSDMSIEILTPSRGTCEKIPVSPRSKILDICDQTTCIPFSKCIPNSMMKNIEKIGEGVFGEVFRTSRNGQPVAIKIIPIEGKTNVNDEPQKTFSEILSEVVISMELSNLRQDSMNKTENFTEVKQVSCVKGSYPTKLLDQWDVFDKAKKSENDRPDFYTEDQLFMVFEFADGGRDLESFQFNSPFQAKSVLQQVCMSLAVAEESLEFEHRDLHIGNVLVREVDRQQVTCRLNGQQVVIDCHGVVVSIIDFTLSRLRKDGCTVFCDLAQDDGLFEGSGDYQFDIYRKMKEENKNHWDSFNSHTNVLWIHYLCNKILNKKYVSNSREDRSVLRDLREFYSQALHFVSAKHVLLESNLFQS